MACLTQTYVGMMRQRPKTCLDIIIRIVQIVSGHYNSSEAKKFANLFDFLFSRLKTEIQKQLFSVLQKSTLAKCYPQPQFFLSNPRREIVSAAEKGTAADFQSCSTTGFRSGGSPRSDTIAKWQAPIWTCCQGGKQKEADHSSQVGGRACLRLRCSK